MLRWRWHHLVNWLESTGIISAMLLLMMWIGWLLGGVVTHPSEDRRTHSPTFRHSASLEPSGNLGMGPRCKSAHSQRPATLASPVGLSLVVGTAHYFITAGIPIGGHPA
uniref:Uncharacterized protein n=1 Tax=mine drainage metagenome TaxID=410659 RepID=E6Q8Q1_9ZZZZ